MLPLLLALLAFQDNANVIEGTVTRFGTDQGLAGVFITITKEGPQGRSGAPETVTDSSGHFTIQNPPLGDYMIQASRAGYLAPVKDGVELEEGGSRKKIIVQPGKSVNVALTLSPASALSGRVLDPMGRPVDGATVEAILVSANGGAGRGRSATTDGRGQFRVWGLPAGRYRLAVDYTSAGFTTSVTGNVLSLGAGRPLYVPETWLKTYFPGTADVDRATLIDVGENASIERLDFSFQTGSRSPAK